MASNLYGRQQPTARVCPEYAETHGPRAYELMRKAGRELMPWQRGLIDDWMARKPNGEWAAPTSGASVARQNGKTCVVAARCASGMMLYGEWIVYTSHLQKTSTETFEEVRSIFEAPALKKYVKDVKQALGREEIVLTNGGRIKFLARTRNGGRGQHGDLWICDEAQELTDGQQGSFLPLLSASKNPQTIYIGTPPDEDAPGEVFSRIRSDALDGVTTKTAWSEWSVAEIGDTSDRTRWAECNPSMGYMIKESTIEAEHEQLAPDKFARERLGWWSVTAKATAISEAKWRECEVERAPDGGTVAYAVKFSADGSLGALACCAKYDGQPPHVEAPYVRDMGEGLTWFADWLEPRAGSAIQIVVDGRSNAQPLIDELLRRGVSKLVLKPPKSTEVADSCSTLDNAVRERKVTHIAQPYVDEAVRNTTKRPIGSSGGWGFDGDGATVMEAIALAHWAALTSKRNPNQTLRIGF